MSRYNVYDESFLDESEDEALFQTMERIFGRAAREVVDISLEEETEDAHTSYSLVRIDDLRALLIIYSNELKRFKAWKKPCSLEFDDPIFSRFGSPGVDDNSSDRFVELGAFISSVILEVRMRLMSVRSQSVLLDSNFSYDSSEDEEDDEFSISPRSPSQAGFRHAY